MSVTKVEMEDGTFMIYVGEEAVLSGLTGPEADDLIGAATG